MFYRKFSRAFTFLFFFLPFSISGSFFSRNNFNSLQKNLSSLCTTKFKLLGLFLFSSIAVYYVVKKSKTGEARAQKIDENTDKIDINHGEIIEVIAKTDQLDKKNDENTDKIDINHGEIIEVIVNTDQLDKKNDESLTENLTKSENNSINQTEVLNLQIVIDENENRNNTVIINDFDLDKILSEYAMLDENRILEISNKVLHESYKNLQKDYSLEELLCAYINLDSRTKDRIINHYQWFNYDSILDYNPKKILLSCFRYCYTQTGSNKECWENFNEIVSSSIGVMPYFYEICKKAVLEEDQNLIYFCTEYLREFLSNLIKSRSSMYWNFQRHFCEMIFSNYDNLCNLYEILVHIDEIQDLLKTNIAVDTIDLIARELFDFINNGNRPPQYIEKVIDILFLSRKFKNEFYKKFHNGPVKSNDYSLVGSYLYGQQSTEKKEKIYQINLDQFNELINKIEHLYSDYEEGKMMLEILNIFQLLVVIANHENNKLSEIMAKLPLLLKKVMLKKFINDAGCCWKLLYCIKLFDLYNIPSSLKEQFIEGLESIMHDSKNKHDSYLPLNKFFETITRTYVELLIEKPENCISDNFPFDSYDQYFYGLSVDWAPQKRVTFINSGLYFLMQEFFNRGNYSIIKNETIFHIGDYSINILLNYYFSDLGYKKGIIFARYFNGFKEMINTEKDIEKISAFINYFKIPLETNTEEINILMSPDDALYKKFLQKCSNQFVSLNDPGFKEFLKNHGLLDNQVEEDFLQHNDQNYTLSSIKEYYERYVHAVNNKNLISTEQYNILCDAFFKKQDTVIFISLFEYFKGPFLHLSTILNSIKNDLESNQQNILVSSISYCFNYFPYCSNKTKCIDTLIDLFKKNMYVIDGCYYTDLKRTCDEDLYWAVEQNKLTLAKTITFLAKNITGYEKNIGFNIFHLLILNNQPEQMQYLVNFFIGYGKTKFLKTLLEKKSEFIRFNGWNNCTPLEKLNALVDEERNKGDNETMNENLKNYFSIKKTLEFADQFVKNDKSLSVYN